MGNSINNIKYLGRKFYGIRNLSTAPAYDPDAQAYFNVNTAITSTADKNAINQFYLDLKGFNIYTKIKVMILPIWLTAGNCKWNLINNRSFDLAFSTGFIFSSSGMTGNGTSSFANTFFNSSVYMLSTGHVGYYSRTQTIAVNQSDIGNINSAVSPNKTSFIVSSSTSIQTRFGSGLIIATKSTTDNRGFILSSRLNNTSLKLYIKGILEATNTNNNTQITPNLNIYLSAYNNNGTAGNYSTKQCCFYTMGDALTDTEATNFNTCVQTLMTHFGIQV